MRITYEMLITLNFHFLKKMLKAPSMMCVYISMASKENASILSGKNHHSLVVYYSLGINTYAYHKGLTSLYPPQEYINNAFKIPYW